MPLSFFGISSFQTYSTRALCLHLRYWWMDGISSSRPRNQKTDRVAALRVLLLLRPGGSRLLQLRVDAEPQKEGVKDRGHHADGGSELVPPAGFPEPRQNDVDDR